MAEPADIERDLNHLFTRPSGRVGTDKAVELFAPDEIPWIAALAARAGLTGSASNMRRLVIGVLALASSGQQEERPRFREPLILGLKAFLDLGVPEDFGTPEQFLSMLRKTLGSDTEMASLVFRTSWGLFVEARASRVEPDLSRLGDLANHRKRFKKAFSEMLIEADSRVADLSLGMDSPLNGLTPVFDSIANQLDIHQYPYPEHMTPTLLSKDTRLVRLRRGARPLDLDSNALYSGFEVEGGRRSSKVLARANRAVVLGDPGSGKSTLLAAAAVASWRSGTGAVFIRLTDLVEALHGSVVTDAESVVAAVVRALTDWLEHPLGPKQEAALKSVIHKSSILLVLDALDEISDGEERARARAAIRTLARLPVRILIGSRYSGYEHIPSFPEFGVASMTHAAARAFIREWFAGGGSRKGRTRALRALKIQKAAGYEPVPMLVGYVAVVAEAGRVPDDRTALYAAYIGHFLDRRGSKRGRSLQRVSQLLSTAKDLAWAMARPGDSFRGWTDVASARALFDYLPHRSSEIGELLEVDGLLTLYGPREIDSAPLNQRYRWAHRGLHEYLVGTYLADQLQTRSSYALEVVQSALQDPQWMPSIVHTFCQLHPEDQELLLKSLIALAALGDPAGILERATLSLAGWCDTYPPVWPVAERMVELGNWDSAMTLDPAWTVAALESGLASGGLVLSGRPALDFPEYLHSIGRDDLIEDVVRSSVKPWVPGTWLAVYGMRDPVDSARRQLSHARSGSSDWVATFGPLAPPGETVMREVVREARSRPYPDNSKFVRLAVALGWNPDHTENFDVLCSLLDIEGGVGFPASPDATRKLIEIATSDVSSERGFRIGNSAWEDVGQENVQPAAAIGALISSNGHTYTPTLKDRESAIDRFEKLASSQHDEPQTMLDALRSLISLEDGLSPAHVTPLVAWLADMQVPISVPWVRNLRMSVASEVGRRIGQAADPRILFPLVRSEIADPSGFGSLSYAARLLEFVPVADRLDIMNWGIENGFCLYHVVGHKDLEGLTRGIGALLDRSSQLHVAWHHECVERLAYHLSRVGALAHHRSALLRLLEAPNRERDEVES